MTHGHRYDKGRVMVQRKRPRVHNHKVRVYSQLCSSICNRGKEGKLLNLSEHLRSPWLPASRLAVETKRDSVCERAEKPPGALTGFTSLFPEPSDL